MVFNKFDEMSLKYRLLEKCTLIATYRNESLNDLSLLTQFD